MRQVDKVFVFERSGIPRLMLNLKDDTLIMDEILLSGFLSAIEGFSNNLFKNESSHFMIEQGNKKISLFKGDKNVLAILSPEDLLPLKTQFDQILKFFTEKYPIGDGQVRDITEYEEFQIKMIRILFYLPIEEDWVPVPIEGSIMFDSIKLIYPIFEDIDGIKEIRNLKEFKTLEREKIFELLNYGYYEKAIIFNNMIDSKDFIIGTEKLQSLIEPDSTIYRSLRANFPKIRPLEIIHDLDYFTRVSELESKHGITTFKAIEFLYKFECIIFIDKDFRKILITIEIINIFLLILQKMNKKKIYQSIKTFIENYDNLEILTKIDFKTSFICIKINKFPYKTQFSNDLTRVYDLWQFFGSALINAFYKKDQKVINSMFFSRLTEYKINCLHETEMDILEPFLIYSESVLNDINLHANQKTIYVCNSKYEELRDRKIPNIIERRLLKMIASEKEIPLSTILEKCKVMEKALNRKIEISVIQDLLKKYVEEGIIFKK